MASTAGFAAVFYSEPAVLGLLANVVSAFLLCLQNFAVAHTGLRPQEAEDILAGVHLILIGGFVQLLAGFLAFRKYDHLGGAAFLTFSALWSSYGATRIITAAYPSLQNTTLPLGNASHLLPTGMAHLSASQSAVAGLVAYISISFILSFCSATVNYIMPFIFGAIALALVFEAVALFSQWALVVSGVIELVIVICGLYGAVALLFKGITQRYVLPGFGHPLFNVLLLGSAQKRSSKAIGEEKKKNTKYAEPMALGNICDTVSPFLFAFYFFGYMKNFCVGAAWISIISSCQLLSSFYSYLRTDVYYTTKFGVHSLYWLPVTEAELGSEETVIRELKNISKKIKGSNKVKVSDGLGHWHIPTVTFQPSCCKSESSWLPEKCFPSSSFNVVLLCMTLAMELLTICFLLFTLENLPLPFEIAMLSIFSIICFYGATASLANCMFGKDLMMMGPPLFTAESSKKDTQEPPPCICPKSHCTSGLRTIADLLNTGAVCGVPTDTVYALAASCKHPQAIEKVYRIKDRPQEKPICIFISNLDQLRAASPPISPLLWEFMENVYPGGIGCIIQKGEWLKKLGVGAGYSRVGTQDSIMIRVPDLTVLVHLIDMTGPLAITSANPSGEVDSTHHDMVISRLGHKLEGVLCDGESDEVVASTVVNCTKIDESGITIVREGCIPAGKVMQIFESVKNRAV
ncbi:threonylcarbamoyl-amp synthase-like isoform x2 [Limosa lapponica baueri]|uniref:Threonylcarbamoyl-AMP synthase n=1 Tax=Limosa lapponica baueri TaxID=1758121 RepID=A0A2I0TPB7_LIMLA|nr:threonylcarbamoyl-amp synthase-like isoform x2 [Limosa lapponica baueri]